MVQLSYRGSVGCSVGHCVTACQTRLNSHPALAGLCWVARLPFAQLSFPHAFCFQQAAWNTGLFSGNVWKSIALWVVVGSGLKHRKFKSGVNHHSRIKHRSLSKQQICQITFQKSASSKTSLGQDLQWSIRHSLLLLSSCTMSSFFIGKTAQILSNCFKWVVTWQSLLLTPRGTISIAWIQRHALCLLLVVWSLEPDSWLCVLARRLPGIAMGLVSQRQLLACSSDCMLLC